MNKGKNFFRWLVGLLLLASLSLGGLGLGRGDLSARAAPVQAVSADAGKVVISEFRTTGPNGLNDEFIELYNRTNASIDITNWEIWKSSKCGASVSPNVATIGTVTLLAGQRYLIGNSPGYSGPINLDLSYSTTIDDEGGIALFDDGGAVVDQVGMCKDTEYKEYKISNPAYLSPLIGTSNRSYARKNNGCTDNDNNYTDFAIQSPSDPQNSGVAPVQCLRVTNVTSPTANGTYSTGDFIQVNVAFSNNVNVTGTPSLLLETGTVNEKAEAIYDPGSSGSPSVLAFTYQVRAGDVSADLDYVGIYSLSLNGGTITGAVGNAVLTLPVPGEPNSLGANKDIVIDNGDPPQLLSFERYKPATMRTNADSLTFRATFSEPVKGVDIIDFSVNGSTSATVTDVLAVGPVNNYHIYDVTVSGGDLVNYSGNVGLDLNVFPTITDGAGNSLPSGEPAVDEIYTLDNSPPNILSITQATGLTSPVTITVPQPVDFTVTFSENINASSFVGSDITSGTGGIPASLLNWSVSPTADPTKFTITADPILSNGLIFPRIDVGKVKDQAGNSNTAPSTNAPNNDNTVKYNDSGRPGVTVNQAASQPDPATTLPITFTVVFSEPIIPSIFTPDDITQNGTAPGVTWSITDTGDHTTFTLMATGTTGFGTLRPSIAANRVTDMVGNNNTPSTSTDNIVKYVVVPTQTPTATPTPTKQLSVIISEVAWAGTKASPDDEWIELYNTTDKVIDITGWILRSSDNSPYIVLSGKIRPKKYFLLEHTDDDTVFDVTANQIYFGTLSNIGEILYLYDKSGHEVDSANKNGGYWPAGNYYTYASMERGDIISDSDFAWVTYDPSLDKASLFAHDASGNVILGTPGRGNVPFEVTATVTPTRTATPVRYAPRAPEDILIINEFLPRPGRDWNQDGLVDVKDEFIEVINAGPTNINLRSYRLDDGDGGSAAFTLPNVTLAPGGRSVFYGSDTGILLNDSGDTVRLYLGSKIVDAYTYGVVRYPDESWCRMPDGANGSQFWTHPCFPTPNIANALTGRLPGPPGYSPIVNACFMPDDAPQPFVQAECTFTNGRGIWNRLFWDGFWKPEVFLSTGSSKWGTFFQ